MKKTKDYPYNTFVAFKNECQKKKEKKKENTISDKHYFVPT